MVSMTANESGHEPYQVCDLVQMQALANPLRLQILEMLAAGPPRTTKQVADALGEKPTRLYHHVARLEKVGLIELAETRPKRGTIEKYYRAVARTFRVDPGLLGGDKLSGTAERLVARAAADLGTLAAQHTATQESPDGGEPPEEAVVAALEVHGSEERVAEVRQRIDDFLSELAAATEPTDTQDALDERRHRLVLAWYPAPKHTP